MNRHPPGFGDLPVSEDERACVLQEEASPEQADLVIVVWTRFAVVEIRQFGTIDPDLLGHFAHRAFLVRFARSQHASDREIEPTGPDVLAL
ncbi:MAG: hypothetical protein RLZ37_1236 [Actinomycetota bacterium]